MSTRWIIGVASGASADGVDAALLEIEGAGLELHARIVQTYYQAYGRDLRALVQQAVGPQPVASRQIVLLHRLLGETLAAAARQVADRARFSLQNVYCLGVPGQLLGHETDGRFPSTLALGMPAVVAERTGVTTVSDFAARDLAVGGQGLPLTALVDYLLFRHQAENRLLIHLGFSARLVYVPAGASPLDVRGFDAGPCNNLLDALMRHATGGRVAFDPGGKHAVQGRCLDGLVQRWLSHSYFQKRPPKCLPPHFFDEEFAVQAQELGRQQLADFHDILCSATHLIARGIAGAIQKYLPPLQPPTRIFLSGGGVRNGLLWRLLEQQLAGTCIDKTDRLGVPAEARKAASFAVLAALTIDGVPANLPSATGAGGARLLGSLTPGSTANWSRCLTWMASQMALPEVEEE